MIALTAIIASGIVPLFMHRRHFIGQDVLVSAILDSKVHRRRAYQPPSNTRQSAGEILRLAVKTVAERRTVRIRTTGGAGGFKASGISIPEVCGANLSGAVS